jgi:hypothetical protein
MQATKKNKDSFLFSSATRCTKCSVTAGGGREMKRSIMRLWAMSGLDERVNGMVLSHTGVVMEKREMTKR